jgi:enoyl-CoA hydratase/carnithine racemase
MSAFGGALHSPEQALSLGLVDKVTEQALESGRKTLARLASYDASVYSETKAMLRDGVMNIDAETEQVFLDAAVPVWTSPALRERLLAHLAKVSGKRA